MKTYKNRWNLSGSIWKYIDLLKRHWKTDAETSDVSTGHGCPCNGCLILKLGQSLTKYITLCSKVFPSMENVQCIQKDFKYMYRLHFFNIKASSFVQAFDMHYIYTFYDENSTNVNINPHLNSKLHVTPNTNFKKIC